LNSFSECLNINLSLRSVFDGVFTLSHILKLNNKQYQGVQEYKNTNKSKTELGMQGDPPKQIKSQNMICKRDP